MSHLQAAFGLGGKMFRRSVFCFALLLCFGPSSLAKAGPDSTAPASGRLEDQALDALTAPFLQDCLDAADQLKKWRSAYDDIKKTLQDDANAGADGTPLDKWVHDVDGFLQKRSPEFLTFLQWKDKVAKIKARHTADDQAACERELAALYSDDLFTTLDSLNGTAKKVQAGLAALVAKNVFGQPYTFEGGVTLQVKGFDPKTFTASPFSKNSGLKVDLVYPFSKGQGPDLHAEASGLYFKPDGTPVLDKLRVTTNANQLVLQALGQGLVKAIAQVDLPFDQKSALKNVRWVDFNQPKEASPGSLKFDLALMLGKGLDFLPNLQVENVVLKTDGTIALGKDGAIDYAVEDPIPLTPTPFVFHNHKFSFTPSKHTGTLSTWLAPDGSQGAADQDSISFQLTVALDLPLTEVKVTGLAYAAGQNFASVKGTLSRKAIVLTLDIPAQRGQIPPLEKLVNGQVTIRLDQNALTGDGTLTYFEGLKAQSNVVLKFNGNGSFGISESATLGPLKAETSLTGGFTPGFKRVTLDGGLMASLDLDVMQVDASVEIEAASDRAKPIRATVSALGVTETVDAANLAELDLNALKKAFNVQPGELIKKMVQVVDVLTKQGADLGAKWGKEFSHSVSDYAKKHGIDAIHTGDKDVDAFLGKTSDAAKDAQKKAGDFVQGTGDTIVKGWQSGVQVVGSYLRSGKHAGISLTDGGTTTRSSRTPQEAHADQVDGRLSAVVRAMNGLLIHRSSLPGSSKTTVSKEGAKLSELRIAVKNCVAAAEGNQDAVLGFAVQVAGFTHDINPNVQQSRPVSRTGVYAGVVHLKGLFGQGTPAVEIDIPTLDHGSQWPANDLLRDAISKLLHDLLPQIPQEGLFDERQLLVENATSERLDVWVQTETHPPGGDKASWIWELGAPGQANQALKFTLDPKHTYVLAGKDRGQVLKGRAARIWAESPSGRTWMANRNVNVWLVNEQPGNEGRRYYADRLEPFVYRLESSNQPIVFRARTVTVSNRTDRPVLFNAKRSRSTPGRARRGPTPGRPGSNPARRSRCQAPTVRCSMRQNSCFGPPTRTSSISAG